MNRAEEILSGYYKKYGYTIPNLDKNCPVEKKNIKDLEDKFKQCAKRLAAQNLRDVFTTCVELWIKSSKHRHIKTISDLYHYHELYRQDSFTKIDSPGKFYGEFNLSIYLHDSDPKKDYAILESPTLRKAQFFTAGTMSKAATDSYTKQVMNCLT